MDIDDGFFYCLLRDRDPRSLSKIKREWVSTLWQPVYDFVLECLSNPEMKKFPSPDTVRAKYGVFLHETTEDIGFFVALLRKRGARLRLEDTIVNECLPLVQSPGEGDEDFNPLKAADTLLTSCAQIKREFRVRKSQVLDYNQDTNARWEAYTRREERQGMMGIPFPYEPLNLATSGMLPGEGTILLARSGIGKTWFYANVCHFAAELGYSVLALSQEMPPRRLSDRIDVIGAGVSPDRYRRGCLREEEKGRVTRYFEHLKQRPGKIFLYGPSDVKSLGEFEALLSMMRSQVDIVCWDSPYLVIRSEKWENRADFCHALKQLIEDYEIPLFATWQLNRTGEPALIDAITTDMDHNFVLTNENLAHLAQVRVFSLKTRDGLKLEQMILKWDLVEGDMKVLTWKIPGVGDSYQSYVVDE